MKWIIIIAFLAFAALVISELVKKGTEKISVEDEAYASNQTYLPSDGELTDSESQAVAEVEATGGSVESLPRPVQVKLAILAGQGRG